MDKKLELLITEIEKVLKNELYTGESELVHDISNQHHAQNPKKELEKLNNSLTGCKKCKLHLNRTNLVFGVGNPGAELMFIGEGPGAEEDLQGEPFVGRAGKLLDRIIDVMGFKREEVYIANIVKCRPPGNRTPEPDEMGICSAFLFRQIDIIRPKVICCLGLPAIQTLIQTKQSMKNLRGRFFNYKGIKILPTYHPAYLLRNPSAKRLVWEDVQKIMDYFGKKPP